MSRGSNFNNQGNNIKSSTNSSSIRIDRRTGSLTIVGSGIQAIRQFTLEARQAIEQADKVLYSVPDPVSELWINKLNINSVSLRNLYVEGKYRHDIYSAITEQILKCVRQGLNVCVIFYGHPGVFVDSTHKSIRQARSEGFHARMLPGISSEDCLFADLGIDPGTHGCQSFEATDFLLRKRKFDLSSHLILWQIGIIGHFTHNSTRDVKHGLGVLSDYLQEYYGSKHRVIVYEAVEYSISKPIIQHFILSELADKAFVDTGSTLYVPPKMSSVPPIDYKIANKLGLKPTNVHFSIKRLFHLTDT